MAEEVESGSAVHLAHDLLCSGVDAFGAAVAPGQGEAGVHGGAVEFEAVAEAAQVGEVNPGYSAELGGLMPRLQNGAADLRGCECLRRIRCKDQGTNLVSKSTGWDRRLSVVADGKRLIGHAGAVLLRRCADRTGLTGALGKVLPSSTATGWRERAGVLVHMAVAIALGAANLSEAEQLQLHQQPLFGPAASDSTARRTLAALDEAALAKIAKVRARVRWHVWSLLCLRPGGFPWLQVAGKRLTGWIVIDIDATIMTATSKKAGATVTFKKTFGFHPLAVWCANTSESLAMLLRPGNAGANTVADHVRVLTDALAQIPGSAAAKILVRVDGAGATHGLLEHLEALNTTRRTVRYAVGWKITDEDERAIARLPEAAWETFVHQDGNLQERATSSRN